MSWGIFQKTSNVQFVGKDVIGINNDNYILLQNIETGLRTIFSANSEIRCFSGHHTIPIFAFAEKSKQPAIFLVKYPEMKIIVNLKDNERNNVTNIGLCNKEYCVELSRNNLTIWNWRTQCKLKTIATNYYQNNDIAISCSSSCNMFYITCEKVLTLVEIFPTFKSCLLSRKCFSFDKIGLTHFIWSSEGTLYCSDDKGNLYTICNDPTTLNITKEYKITCSTSLFTYHNCGFVIYYENEELKQLKYIKKNQKCWTSYWNVETSYNFTKLLSSGLEDNHNLLAWTRDGFIIKITQSHNNHIAYMKNKICFLDIIGDKMLTASQDGFVCMWDLRDGNMLCRMLLDERILNMKSCLTKPLVVITGFHNGNYCVRLVRIIGENICSAMFFPISPNLITNVVLSDADDFIIITTIHNISIIQIEDHFQVNLRNINLIKTNKAIVSILTLHVQNTNFLIYLEMTDEKNGLIFYNIDEKCKPNVKYYDGNKMEIKNLLVSHKQQIIVETNFKEICILSFKKIDNNLLVEKMYCIKTAVSVKITKCYNGIILWTVHGYYEYRTFQNITNSSKYFNVGENSTSNYLRNMIVDPEENFLLSLYNDGDIFVSSLKNGVTENQSININSENLIVLSDSSQQVPWIKQIEKYEKEKENNKWQSLKSELENQFNELSKNLTNLINRNNAMDEYHRLSIRNFHLDSISYTDKLKYGSAQCKALKIKLRKRIQLQNQVIDWIKKKCWDCAVIPSTQIHSIYSHEWIDNYVMQKQSKQIRYNNFIDVTHNIECIYNNHIFFAWRSDGSENFGFTLLQTTSFKYGDKQPRKSQQITQEFLLNILWEMSAAQISYNILFDNIMASKTQHLHDVKETNKRLTIIVNELDTLSKLKNESGLSMEIEDPCWIQEENPSLLFSLNDYIKKSDNVENSDNKSVDIDDNNSAIFHTNVLNNIMDGTLQLLWHEEIKKDVPKPQIMITKEKQYYNHEDLKKIQQWKSEIEKRISERQKYEEMLKNEFNQLSSESNKSILHFNKQIQKNYELKIKYQSAIEQEILGIIYARTKHMKIIKTKKDILGKEMQISNIERELEQLSNDIKEIQSHLSDCQQLLEVVQTKDKLLDKNFKQNFMDVSPVVLDICYKLFKKRPKWNPKMYVTSGMYAEMAQSSISKEKNTFKLLTNECCEYLKNLDQLDLSSNMPPVIDETFWTNLCKLRRNKIENELKMNAVNIQATEIDVALVTWQKKIFFLRQTAQKIKFELNATRIVNESEKHNYQIQFCIKYGSIETNLNGTEKNFCDSLLIKKDDITAINNSITVALASKMKMTNVNLNFKKHIHSINWELENLEIKIAHLKENILYFQRIPITREIISMLPHITASKTLPLTFYMDKQVKCEYDKLISHHTMFVDDLEIKLVSIRKKLSSLNIFLNKCKSEVMEQNTFDKHNNKKQIEKLLKQSTMNIIYRNKLCKQVQKQHSVIILLLAELELLQLRTYPTLKI